MELKQYDLGLRALVNFRPGTSDEEILRSILIDRNEYQLFSDIPKDAALTIFDVGANIGATSILLANTYPNATIYAFEPEVENFKILLANVDPYPNVKPYNVALGAATGTAKLAASDNPTNLGGFSFGEAGVNLGKKVEVLVCSVKDMIESIDLKKIDLIKVDTEGCEFEILSSMPEGFLPDFIMGEAHGNDDFLMFDMLSKTHQLKINKEFAQRCYPFYARKLPDAPGT